MFIFVVHDYYQNGWMLVQMADAIGRLVLAGREPACLSGFTARVFELIKVLRDLHNGVYQRTMVSSSDTPEDGMMYKFRGILKFSLYL